MEWQREEESVERFCRRLDSYSRDSLRADCELNTSAGLRDKVEPSGALRPFAGNTVVFELPEETRDAIGRMQARLLAACGGLLAGRLDPQTFHVTLHDLCAGPPSGELEQRVRDTQGAALERVRAIARAGGAVEMRSTVAFQLACTSIVVGFVPVDERGCRKLGEWYDAFQDVVLLERPLTPHVTLAYFRPETLCAESVNRLRAVLEQINAGPPLRVRLEAARLRYQVFSDMNHYRSVPAD